MDDTVHILFHQTQFIEHERLTRIVPAVVCCRFGRSNASIDIVLFISPFR